MIHIISQYDRERDMLREAVKEKPMSIRYTVLSVISSSQKKYKKVIR